jgi:hypothetical protein
LPTPFSRGELYAVPSPPKGHPNPVTIELTIHGHTISASRTSSDWIHAWHWNVRCTSALPGPPIDFQVLAPAEEAPAAIARRAEARIGQRLLIVAALRYGELAHPSALHR